MFRAIPVILAATLSSGIVIGNSAFAQTDPGLGPLIAPIQPEPRLGLPGQDPSILDVAEPPVTPREAAPAPAPAEGETRTPAREAAAAPTAEGEWETECVETQSSARGCQAIIRAIIGERTALVLAVASVDGLNRIQMALPLGFSVKDPVRIELGDFTVEMPVSRCTAQGCLVEEDAPAEFIEALTEAEEAGRIVLRSVAGDAIELPLPVAGAGEALAAAVAAEQTQ